MAKCKFKTVPYGSTGIRLVCGVLSQYGTFKAVPTRLPTTKQVPYADAVTSTGERFVFKEHPTNLSKRGTTHDCIVVQPNVKQTSPQCFGCVFYHRPSSKTCGAVTRFMTAFPRQQDPRILYDIRTSSVIGRIAAREVLPNRRPLVSREIIRIASI